MLELHGVLGAWGKGHRFSSVIGRSYSSLLFQTCFVDCLIEQTHPEIRKRYDQDVSITWARSFPVFTQHSHQCCLRPAAVGLDFINRWKQVISAFSGAWGMLTCSNFRWSVLHLGSLLSDVFWLWQSPLSCRFMNSLFYKYHTIEPCCFRGKFKCLWTRPAVAASLSAINVQTLPNWLLRHVRREGWHRPPFPL